MTLLGKLYMVLVVGGQVTGVAGPLPYDAAECEKRGRELVVRQDEWQRRNPEMVGKVPYITVYCVHRTKRPVMDSPWQGSEEHVKGTNE